MGYGSQSGGGMIFGILRVVGLRLMGKLWGAWIDPAAGLAVAAFVAVALVIGAVQFWPRGHGDGGVTQAIVQAAAERDKIEAERAKQEKADNEWIERFVAAQAAVRTAADTASGDADRVVIPAGDGWLRSKQRAAGR
jgi:hypothetical protein